MAASCTLYQPQAWICDPTVPTVFVQSGTGGNVGGGGQRLTTKTRSGSVRTYGSGRVRNVAGANTVATYDLALIHLTQTELNQLEAWMNLGTLLLFRDTYGQRDYGTIFSVSEYAEPMTVDITAPPSNPFLAPNGPFWDCALTINAVTVPAGT
jgi:hypothetical protein